MSTLIRWFIYDVGYGDTGLEEVLNLSPVSEEGAEKELSDSDLRLDQLLPLLPYIDAMGDIASSVLSVIALDSAEDNETLKDENLEKIAEMLKNLYQSISLSSILGAFSVAKALGLIEITAISGEVKDLHLDEGDDDERF